MNKSQPLSAAPADEAGPISILAPMQESLERFHRASGRLTETCTEIAAEQTAFLQRTLFDSLSEIQTLRHARVPAEFFQASMEFGWQQAERWLKAVGEIGNEACSCWFEALKATPSLAPRHRERRSVH
jgi:hypothetical protein